MVMCCSCGRFAAYSSCFPGGALSSAAAATTTTTTSLRFPFLFREMGTRAGGRVVRTGLLASNHRISIATAVRASVVDSHGSSSEFIKRMEQAWLISQQPGPIPCSSCGSKGHTECKWCRGTGFFIIGDNMLCEVPSRNTTCVICNGKGSACCRDCKGTGFRAKWLDQPPPSPHGASQA
ncbi:unnamed protein product [Spirodela intermedia]|uniref:Uncharacterized protein n=1 Tax=Spirodela intermedia TaxID=51605 RepID=A0A7I8LBE4_SPIIN|nr:unnamed protein product [Spirodela intermedia]